MFIRQEEYNNKKRVDDKEDEYNPIKQHTKKALHQEKAYRHHIPSLKKGNVLYT